MNRQVAVFGGGCFWCTEAIFKSLKGVLSVEPGYAGGNMKNPSYYDVSGGLTGHAEVVRIEFDGDAIPYETLLDVFFHTHNPTTLNKQGNDIGTQYRSIILYTSDAQKEAAEGAIGKLMQSGEYEKPIVTEVEPLGEYFPAEDYHKDYYKNNTNAPYCQLVISPKLTKLRALYKKELK